MIGLTPRARELLVYLTERDVCPTYREMGEALGFSMGSVSRAVARLEAGGYIRRLRNRRQAIEVLIPACTPVIINGERYRFIPVSCGTPGAACTPIRPPLSSSAIEPAVASDLPVGAAADFATGRS